MKYFLALILSAVTLFGIGYVSYEKGDKDGMDKVTRQWNDAKLQQANEEALAIETRLKQNAAIEAKQRQENQLLKASYEKKIVNLRSDYAHVGRLRISKNLCEGFASGAQAQGTSTGDAGAATSWLLPEKSSEDFKRLMLEADELVEAYRITQDYLKATAQDP